MSDKRQVAELTGDELQQLAAALFNRAGAGRLDSLHITIDGGLKYKINHGMWSPPVGSVRETS